MVEYNICFTLPRTNPGYSIRRYAAPAIPPTASASRILHTTPDLGFFDIGFSMSQKQGVSALFFLRRGSKNSTVVHHALRPVAIVLDAIAESTLNQVGDAFPAKIEPAQE